MAGVLVAISIPIFTGQLAKARLATNQANARAAYAAATTQYMLDYKDTVPATDEVTYVYENAKGAGSFGTAATADITGDKVDISKWDVDTTSATKKLGDATAKQWSVVLNKDGSVKGYLAAY